MSSTLSAPQAHALLDILTHAQTCAEIEKFKHGGAIEGYGPPFSSGDTPSTSPILQGLLSRFALNLPGLRDVSSIFWEKRCRTLVDKFGEADLSDSYDKGGIGARRTLGTAYSTLFEYPTRGILGGWPKEIVDRPEDDYDPSKSDDVIQAWHDWVQKVVHGNMVDTMFDKAAETGKLEEHSKLVQAAHEYILVNIGATMHYMMVLSPDGQYLARIIANIHTLVPYFAIGQTLRVGNAATMINGMLRLVLAKLSVTSITNWIGLTNSPDDGMNLLQRIMSQAISWDVVEFQRQATALERKKSAPSKQHLEAIKTHINHIDRSKQELVRQTSIIESKSIVTVILASTSPTLPPLSEAEHEIATEYLSIQLSIRDRREIDHILNQHVPDLVTQAVKDVVAAFDPIIRGVHNAADLSSSLTDFQNFMDDFVKLAKRPFIGKRRIRNPGGVSISAAGSDAEGSGTDDNHHPDIPSVEDYVKLVRKHIPNSHKFLHQVAKNGKDVTQGYRDYCKLFVSQFRQHGLEPVADGKAHGAGALTPDLNNLFDTLSSPDKERVVSALDQHAEYLEVLRAASEKRMHSILDGRSSTGVGPGMYLSRWQDLLDQTLISPAKAEGPVRTGADASIKPEIGGSGERKKKIGVRSAKAPDVKVVLDLLGDGFREIVKVKTMDAAAATRG